MRPQLPGDKLHKAAGVIGLDSADDAYDALSRTGRGPPTL